MTYCISIRIICIKNSVRKRNHDFVSIFRIREFSLYIRHFKRTRKKWVTDLLRNTLKTTQHETYEKRIETTFGKTIRVMSL